MPKEVSNTKNECRIAVVGGLEADRGGYLGAKLECEEAT